MYMSRNYSTLKKKKKIDETKNYFLKETKQNYLMSK